MFLEVQLGGNQEFWQTLQCHPVKDKCIRHITLLVLQEREYFAQRLLILGQRQLSDSGEKLVLNCRVIKTLWRTARFVFYRRERTFQGLPELNLLLRCGSGGLAGI